MATRGRWLVHELPSGIVLLLLVGAGVSQYFAYQTERDDLTRRLESLAKDLRNLEVVEHHRVEFETEDAALRARLALLRRAIPPDLGTDAFIRSLRDSARAEGVTIDGLDAEERAEPPVGKARIVLRLRGSAAAVNRLARRIEAGPRLAVWGKPTAGGPSAFIVIIYSLPAVPMPRFRDECQPPPSRLWFPLYSGATREDRKRLEERCLEMERHRETRARVLEMERQRTEARALVEIISHLKPELAAAPSVGAVNLEPT